eukprot:jgi/Tetstr1/445451/TSEL_033230.t1
MRADGQNDMHRPLANLELPTVEQLAEAIPASISQRINTPPELRHTQWLTDTMMVVGIDMLQYHTEPKLLRVEDDNLFAISLGKEDEEFADTLRLAVALTSPVALVPPNNYGPAHARTATAHAATVMTGVQAEDEDELELNYEENDSTMDVDTA